MELSVDRAHLDTPETSVATVGACRCLALDRTGSTSRGRVRSPIYLVRAWLRLTLLARTYGASMSADSTPIGLR